MQFEFGLQLLFTEITECPALKESFKEISRVQKWYQSIGLALIFGLREYTKNQSIPWGANNISATAGTSVYIAEVGKVNFKSNRDEALSDESP